MRDPSVVRRLELAREGVIGPAGDGSTVIAGRVGARERSGSGRPDVFRAGITSSGCTNAPPGP
jgi:hypothetical protein